MNQTNPDTACSSSQAFKPILLYRETNGWVATATAADYMYGIGFAPFFVPLPPRSLVDWLVVTGHRFWREHQRCMAALLLLNCRNGRWTLRLPNQHCGPTGSCWSPNKTDFPDLSNAFRIGGTFQSIAGNEPAIGAVPADCGFHFTLNVTAERPLAAFFRDVVAVQSADPQCLLANDWAQAIDAALPRLRLA